jgi:hypothetical protein
MEGIATLPLRPAKSVVIGADVGICSFEVEMKGKTNRINTKKIP